MENNNKELFEEFADAPTSQQQEKVSEAMPMEASHYTEKHDLEEEEFVARVSSKSIAEKKAEKGVKEKANGKTFTVRSMTVLPPKTKKFENGEYVRIEPETNAAKTSSWYVSKLEVRFEEDNLIEYYRGLNVFVNEGKLNRDVSIYREGRGTVSTLAKLILCKMSKGKFKLVPKKINKVEYLVIPDEQEAAFKLFHENISDEDILNYLVGKKIKIFTEEGEYNNRRWYRNDIVEILD